MSPTNPGAGGGPTAATPAPSGLVVDATVRRGGFGLDVDLATPGGQVVAVLGPNGAGKSTLLGALAGLVPVTTGRITLDGRVLDDAGTGEFVEPPRRGVGFVFQDYRLFAHLSVLDNVAFARRARGDSRRQARSAARPWLARLGIDALADRRSADLSGGQAQRVALARALAGEPGLLLLDEPLAALDARTRLEVQSELRGHLRDFAGPCLLVTHDPVEALVLADRLVVLESGRVVQDAAPGDVVRRPATDYVATLIGLNLYRGVVDGPHVVLDEGGRLHVPDHGQHGRVMVAVRPSAIVVSPTPPGPSSARNTWPARVTGLSLLADRVRLDLDGEPPAVVDVTPAAVADLGLVAGMGVWLTTKATEIEVYDPDAPRA